MTYATEEFGHVGRSRHGSPTFYQLLEKMAEVHDRKSHDYASNQNPYGNYHFAGQLSQLFRNPHDAGFLGRLGEKLFRLANLENDGKIALNEKIEDTEDDLCVIMALWMSSRRDGRRDSQVNQGRMATDETEGSGSFGDHTDFLDKPLTTSKGLEPENIAGQIQVLDLLTLMPDHQVDRFLAETTEYIRQLRLARKVNAEGEMLKARSANPTPRR